MLEQFYKRYNFSKDGKLFYGVFNGRIISSLTNGSYLKMTISFNKPLDRNQGQACSIRLKEIKEQFKIVQQAIVTNISVELILYLASDLEENIEKILTKVISIVDQFQECGMETCPICGRILSTDCPFVRIKDVVVQAHPECVNQLEGASSNAMKAMNGGKKSVGKVLLVSFLVMIVTSLIMGLLGLAGIYSFLGFLAGFIAFIAINFFTRKLKIKRDMFLFVCMIVTSILTLILSAYLGTLADMYIMLKEQHSFMKVFLDFFKILDANPDYLKYVLYNLGSGILICGINFYINYRHLKMLKNGTIKKL